MSYKVGVFGSAINESEEAAQKAELLGKALAENDCIVANGGCDGMPRMVAQAAKEHGGSVWGFSPNRNKEEHAADYPEQNLELYDKLIFVPEQYEFAENDLARKKYRNISSTHTCDAGIIISGRWGSMNEFTNLFDLGKVIGVLTGTGGIADELPRLTEVIKKKSKAVVLFDDDPAELVTKIINTLNQN